MKLPIGIQTFATIRTEDYVYIDKTKEALDLIENYKYVFLARPRRFGKSLFLDTLKNIFEGKKELFKGLYIYDKYDFANYPVIKISWSGYMQTTADLHARVFAIFASNQERLGIKEYNRDNPFSCFDTIIKKVYQKYKQKVVILIDEYDKPILDVIEDRTQAIKNREFIKGFYSIIKDNDEYIRFAFLTGVSKFSKASIFSGLNMLEDISLSPRFGNICGYTHKDIKEKFHDYLTNETKLEKIKEWYNGYYFLKDKIYNPFDILQYFRNKVFDNYWFESGTPTFLIKLIQSNNYYLPQLNKIEIGKELLSSFDLENMCLETILYQSGYLTIKDYIADDDGIFYTLTLPNKEVRISLFKFIIEYLYQQNPTPIVRRIRKTLKEANLKEFKKILHSLFASIPYHNYTKNELSKYEGFYASVIYAYLQSLGFEIKVEDPTNRGRVDMTILAESNIYIIEFKVINSQNLTSPNVSNPLEQIKAKRYYEKYQTIDKEYSIYLVGIVFDESKRNVVNFAYEKLKATSQ